MRGEACDKRWSFPESRSHPLPRSHQAPVLFPWAPSPMASAARSACPGPAQAPLLPLGPSDVISGLLPAGLCGGGGFLAGQPTLKPAYSAASPQGAVQAQGDVRCVQPHSHHLSLCRHPGGSPSSPTSWSRVTFWDVLSPHGSAVAETPPFLGGFSRPFLLAHTPPHTLGGSSSLPCFSSSSPYLLASATWGLLK